MNTESDKITVADLDKLTAEMFDKRRQLEAHSEVGKKIQAELDELKTKMVVYLKDLGRDSYPTPDGTAYIIQRWNVTIPATVEDKKAFFQYLREKGMFESYATVNYQALNSLYREELEEAMKRGDGMSFKIPGIGDPTLFETLGMRKK